MRNAFPFADYDFWGFLTAGAYLLAVVCFGLGLNPLDLDTPSLPTAVLLVGAAYTLGHVNAAVSSFLLEDVVAGKLIGRPVEILIGQRMPPALVRKLMPRFSKGLGADPIARLQGAGVSLPMQAEDLFHHAFNHARSFSDSKERLDSFRNQYGFCRNMSMAGVMSIPIFFFLTPVAQAELKWLLVCVAMFVSFVLYIRYLIFYRHFALEAVNALAYREIK